MIHADDFNWKMERHMALRNQYHAQYSDKERGVTKETITNRTCGGYGIGKSKSYYFINDDPREFLSAEDLADAYNEKFKFSEENPEQEVKYIKVVVKKGVTKRLPEKGSS
jgi:hypothetical protein